MDAPIEEGPTTALAKLPVALRAQLFVVIAAYNEEHAIGRVVRELREDLPNVVVVDDGSADDTTG